MTPELASVTTALLSTPMSTSTHTALGRRLAIGRTHQMRTMIQNARHNGSDAVRFHASQSATVSERRKIIFNVFGFSPVFVNGQLGGGLRFNDVPACFEPALSQLLHHLEGRWGLWPGTRMRAIEQWE
jgi:hypothetical protein